MLFTTNIPVIISIEKNMNGETIEKSHFSALKLLFVAAFIIVGLWFIYEVIGILFYFFFAMVLAMVLNTPVMWLIKRGLSRTAASLIVFFTLVIFLAGLFWLVIPRVLNQVSSLINDIPAYYDSLKMQAASWLEDYPALQKKVLDDSGLMNNMPSARRIFLGVSQFSITILGSAFFFIIFLSIVAYMLLNPMPLIKLYLLFFPPNRRERAATALANASGMMRGWLWANFLVGAMEAILVFIFLSFMGVPGVWVWAALALFGQLVPRLGFYIMAVPPIVIALSINPATALWVLVFYLLLDEIMADFVMPRIRAHAMKLHPVLSLFAMLTMATAFGLTGALVATPFIGFVQVYFQEFYLSKLSKNGIEEQVDRILKA